MTAPPPYGPTPDQPTSYPQSYGQQQYGPPSGYVPLGYGPPPGYGPRIPVASRSCPATLSMAGAITFILATACGVLGIALVFVFAISLAAARRVTDSAFGSGAYSSLTSTTWGSDLEGDVAAAVVVSVLILLLAIALAWGAIAAVTGTATTTAVVANVITFVLLLLAAVNIHPLLLMLTVLPIAAVIGLRSPTSKAFLARRTGGEV